MYGKRVKMPFLERFKGPLLDDRKTWTSRSKRMADPGDTFPAFGHDFLVEKVERRMLDDVANHWSEEGCISKEDFIEVWKTIHYRVGYAGSRRVHVHIFRGISI